MWVDALLAFGGKTQGGQELLILEGYLELDKEICSPVTALIYLLGTRVLRALLGAKEVFPRAAPTCGPGL